ncbi:MAG: c-type cytochrome [Cyclobacteriaceae bacterium]
MSTTMLSFCQPKKQVGADFQFEEVIAETQNKTGAERIDLDSKGVGPISVVELDQIVNQEMALKGKAVFDLKCVACHKVEERFMGPAMKGVTKRRTAEWIMNMILNPNEMVNKDSLAMEVFIAFDGMPMSNMGLTEKEAREVLEYFRSIDS